ncbi:MAG: hypothetical protein QM271_08565 [Bacillota bacterium]|nr:hypothetical protein [Bacillota bacterium]
MSEEDRSTQYPLDEYTEVQIGPDEPLEEEQKEDLGYMSAWGERANRIGEKGWDLIQIAFGILLGFAVSACLYLIKSEGFLALNVILAFLIARFGPRGLEMLFERKMPKANVAMLITLAVTIAVYGIYLMAFDGKPLVE